MEKMLINKFFLGALVLLAFSYYILSLNYIPQKIAASIRWIKIDWTNAKSLISNDCLPINFLSNEDKKNYMVVTFDFPQKAKLTPFSLENEEKCWLLSTDFDDSGNTKIMYETIDGKIKEIFVKNFSF